jgi:hypothetical protein
LSINGIWAFRIPTTWSFDHWEVHLVGGRCDRRTARPPPSEQASNLTPWCCSHLAPFLLPLPWLAELRLTTLSSSFCAALNKPGIITLYLWPCGPCRWLSPVLLVSLFGDADSLSCLWVCWFFFFGLWWLCLWYIGTDWYQWGKGFVQITLLRSKMVPTDPCCLALVWLLLLSDGLFVTIVLWYENLLVLLSPLCWLTCEQSLLSWPDLACVSRFVPLASCTSLLVLWFLLV